MRGSSAPPKPADLETADGFAAYFRTLGEGSRYSPEQFRDYFHPLDPDSFRGKEVVELGFGHGSWLHHWSLCGPARLSGCDLGDAVEAARRKLRHMPEGVLNLQRADLTMADLGEHDLAYCIGVIHHLRDPHAGFEAVLRHTKPGGRFHCWVYSREGNAVVIHGVDVLRRLGSRLPWWATKWSSGLFVALPLLVYSRGLGWLTRRGDRGARLASHLPLAGHLLPHAGRDFRFFHFLATDFLVARHTVYLDRDTLAAWMKRPEIDPDSVYLLHRHSKSWQFGGRKRSSFPAC
jgi:SAM-dependent methyltransferase